MNDSLVLSVGIFAFVMMLIGLALTAWEFRYGQPRREAARARVPGRTRSSRAHDFTHAASTSS